MRPLRAIAAWALIAWSGITHAAATPVPPAAPSAQILPDARQVIDLLDSTVTCYRSLAAQQQLASDPGDVFLLADSPGDR